VLKDPPDRFDLGLSWAPPRTVANTFLLEKRLGTPYGKSATKDDGWVIQGGILEVTESVRTETPYLLFSSPGYVRDPLDFLEATNLPHLPSLESISSYLERNASESSPPRVEESGFESRTFRIAKRQFNYGLLRIRIWASKSPTWRF